MVSGAKACSAAELEPRAFQPPDLKPLVADAYIIMFSVEFVRVSNTWRDFLLALLQRNTGGHHPSRVHRTLKIDGLFFVSVTSTQGQRAILADLDISLSIDRETLRGITQDAIG